jgi:hypothetical protein
MLGDVLVGYVRTAVYPDGADERISGRWLEPLIRDQNHLQREPLGGAEHQLFHIPGRGVCINPDSQSLSFQSIAWPAPGSSQLRVYRALGFEASDQIARFGAEELTRGTHIDLCATLCVASGARICHDPCTGLRRQIGNSIERKTRLDLTQRAVRANQPACGKAGSGIRSTGQRCCDDGDQEQSTHEIS